MQKRKPCLISTNSDVPLPVWKTSLYNVCSNQIQVSIFKYNAGIFSTQLHLQRNHACLLWNCNASITTSKADQQHCDKSVEEKLLAHGKLRMCGNILSYHLEGTNSHLIQFTPGCIVRKSPISEPFPVTQLIRPLGKPAKWKQWTMCKAETAPWNASLNKHLQERN